MDNVFKTIIGSRGYLLYRYSTWENIKKNRQVALYIDQNSTAICIFPRDNCIVPLELSRIFYSFIKRGGKVSGPIHSTEYKRSPIPEGGLEVPIEVTFACDDKINHDLIKIKSLAEIYEGFDSVKDVEHVDDDDECEVSLACPEL